MPRHVRKALAAVLLWIVVPVSGHCEVITRLPTSERVVALTFDACETMTPSYFDRTILDYLLREQIPATLFVSGKFAKRNQSVLHDLARVESFEVENHSLSHSQHMEKLDEATVRREVLENEAILLEATGVKPLFFRFPAGSYNSATLRLVESLGYRVVHWSFASGDPNRHTGASQLTRWVLDRVRPGSILIFHINGRGYHTGEALPRIVEELRQRGYRFVTLKESLGAGH
ncbi:MAG: polysaccharide deacetylase family protein [Syntrophobacteraceae bacterium]